MNVEQEDIDLMAELFDYAALSIGQPRVSPMAESTRRQRHEGSNSPPNHFPQSAIPASSDSDVMDMRQGHAESLAVPDNPDWSIDDLDVFPEMMNDSTFLGQRWSTYLPEEAAYQ